MDAAHAGAHLRPELEQLEANGRDGGIGELAMAQTDAAQGIGSPRPAGNVCVEIGSAEKGSVVGCFTLRGNEGLRHVPIDQACLRQQYGQRIEHACPVVGTPNFRQNVGHRRLQLQPGFLQEPRHGAHHPWTGTYACDDSRIHLRPFRRVIRADRKRSIITIENHDDTTGPDDASGFSNDGRGVVDMADERVGQHGIEACIGQIERTGVSDTEADLLGKTLLTRQSGGRLYKVGAEVDSKNTAVEILPLSEPPSNETRATSHIQHVFERVRPDAIEILRQYLQKNRLLRPISRRSTTTSSVWASSSFVRLYTSVMARLSILYDAQHCDYGYPKVMPPMKSKASLGENGCMNGPARTSR